MTDLVNRIDALVHELLELNTRIEAEMLQASANPDESQLLKQPGLLKVFKRAVDHTRHLLWPCILAAEQKAEENITMTLLAYRMERIEQMLTAVRDEAGATSSVQLFLSKIQRIAKPQRPN